MARDCAQQSARSIPLRSARDVSAALSDPSRDTYMDAERRHSLADQPTTMLFSLLLPLAAAVAASDVQQHYTFLSPALDFSGDWETNNLNAFTRGGNVSVAVAGSGITFTAKSDAMTILVNGSQPAIPTNITNEYAEISHLPYGWYEFTLVSEGNCTLSSARAITDGERWQVNDTQPVNVANSSSVTTTGQWNREVHRLTTNSTDAGLHIDVPAGTALLELLVDVPSTPFGGFDVCISPAPPLNPAFESFTPNLQPADIQFMIGQLNVPVYSVLLDPGAKYSVSISITNTEFWAVNNVKFYPSVQPAERS